jgi:hypothetical protein
MPTLSRYLLVLVYATVIVIIGTCSEGLQCLPYIFILCLVYIMPATMTMVNVRAVKQLQIARLAPTPTTASPSVPSMFSYNMTHLRGAKQCGSCSGK